MSDWERVPNPSGSGTTGYSRLGNNVFVGRSQRLPIADFVGVQTNNTSLLVTFTDNSFDPKGGTITAWSWNFGDGTVSVAQNPTHTYATSGVFNVTLTVTDSSHLIAVSRQILIASVEEIQVPSGIPVARFSTATSGLTATFTDLTTDSDGTIVTWDWNFGESPTAKFISSQTDLTSKFTDQSTDVPPGSVVRVLWNFGDTSSSTQTNPSHTYAVGGGYNVDLTATDNEGNSGTTTSTISLSVGSRGIAWGPFDLFTTYGGAPLATGFTGSVNYVSPSGFVSFLSNLNTRGHQVVLKPTGDPKTTYMSNGVFDIEKWKAKLALYNQPAILEAANLRVRQKTLLGFSLMDEPTHSGWGVAGGVPKATLDEMARFSKSIFTTVPAGVVCFHTHRSAETYRDIDFIMDETWKQTEPSTTYRDAALIAAARNNIAIAFEINLLAGPDVSSCYSPPGRATCAMLPSEITDWAVTLGKVGVGMFMWRYDSTLFSLASYTSAFSYVASILSALPQRSWYRTA